MVKEWDELRESINNIQTTEEDYEKQYTLRKIDRIIAYEESLEKTLKDVLFYLELHDKDCDEEGISHKTSDPTSWAYNITQMLRHNLGHEHAEYAGYDFRSVLNVWIVMEIWKDGKIMPRCITLTKREAEHYKDQLLYFYENRKERKDRPILSVERQRTEHIFGFEMQGGKARKFEGVIPPEF